MSHLVEALHFLLHGMHLYFGDRCHIRLPERKRLLPPDSACFALAPCAVFGSPCMDSCVLRRKLSRYCVKVVCQSQEPPS